jgi:hypothetical protein
VLVPNQVVRISCSANPNDSLPAATERANTSPSASATPVRTPAPVSGAASSHPGAEGEDGEPGTNEFASSAGVLRLANPTACSISRVTPSPSTP